MKTILLGILGLFPCVVLAASAPVGGVPDPTVELKVMTEKLNFSTDQQTKVAPILVAEANQRKAIQNDSNLTNRQKHDQSGAVHRSALQQIKALFTPDQIALVEQAQQHLSTGPTHPSTSPTTAN